MKGSTLKIIITVIVTIVILIGLGIYIINRSPQLKFGIAKYATNWSIDRSVRQGKMSQETANQIKTVLNRIYRTAIKLESLGVEEEKIEEEALAILSSSELQQVSDEDGLSEEELRVLLDFLNKMADRLDELADEAADSP